MTRQRQAESHFNEITKNAVKQSIKQARDIDINLVDAQQTRRDARQNGGISYQSTSYGLRLRDGLSAGRVQSVALRLICDREE